MAFFPTQDLVAKPIENYVWDPVGMAWVKETQPSGGGGGGGTSSIFGAAFPATGTAAGFKDSSGNMAGANLDASGNLLVNVAAGGSTGAVTIADGADVTQGAKADSAATNSTSSWSVVSLLKGLYSLLAGTLTVGGSVSVSNFPATQPVSGTVTANQGTAGSSAWKVDGSGVTQPISGSVSVSNFPATQPVSGTITSNQGTANATPWNENIAQWGGSVVTLGQNVSASSVPVVLASDQTVSVSSGLPPNAAQETGGNLASASQKLNSIQNITQNTLIQLLSDIRMELRIMNAQHQQAFGLRDELDTFRADPYYASSGYDNSVN